MNTKILVEQAEELRVLLQHKLELEQVLKLVSGNETESILDLKLIRLVIPPVPERDVLDCEGNVIDWSDFPATYKYMPFQIVPQARLKEYPEFKAHLQFKLKTDFLIPTLTSLLRQINLRIENLQTLLTNGQKNTIQ